MFLMAAISRGALNAGARVGDRNGAIASRREVRDDVGRPGSAVCNRAVTH